MLTIILGDLFDYAKPGDMIVHGCNCQGKMESGFAAQVRRRFPIVYLEYAQLHRDDGLLLGEHLAVYCDKYCIFNAFTQQNYGKTKGVVYVDYTAVEKCLKDAANMAKHLNMKVFLPLVGGGLAGGDPLILYSIFEKVFDKVEAYLVLPIGFPVKILEKSESK